MVSRSQLLQGSQSNRIQRRQVSRARQAEAARQQQVQKSQQQKEQINQELAKLAQRSRELVELKKAYEGDKMALREVQAKQKQLNAEGKALNQIKAGLQQGYVYQNIGQAISQVKQAGQTAYDIEGVRTAQTRISQKRARLISQTQLSPTTQSAVVSQTKTYSQPKVIRDAFGRVVAIEEGGQSREPTVVEKATGIVKSSQTTQTQSVAEIKNQIIPDSAGKQFYNTYIQPTEAKITAETERIKDIGYTVGVTGKKITDKQAKIIAIESIKRGGVSFSPNEVNKILAKEQMSEVGGRIDKNIQKGVNVLFTQPTTAISKGTYDPTKGGHFGKSYTGESGSLFFESSAAPEKSASARAIDKTVDTTTTFIKKTTTSFVESEPYKKVTGTILGTKITPKGEMTFGELLVFGEEKTKKFLETSKKGWGEISTKFFESSRGKPRVVKNILESAGYLSIGAGEAVGQAEPIIGFTVTPVGYSAVKFLETEQKVIEPDKYEKEELEKRWKEYSSSYDQAKENLKEGYELTEEKLTKKEFFDKERPKVSSMIKGQFRSEQLIYGGTALGGFALKGYKGGKDFLFEERPIKSSIKGGKVIEIEPMANIKVVEGKTYLSSKSSFRNVVTPKTELYQSRFGKLRGNEPTMKIIQKGQAYIARPIGNVDEGVIKIKKNIDINKPIVFDVGRVGKKGNLVNIRKQVVGGDVQNVLRQDIINLPEQQKKIFSKTLNIRTSEGERLYIGNKKTAQFGFYETTGDASITLKEGVVKSLLREKRTSSLKGVRVMTKEVQPEFKVISKTTEAGRVRRTGAIDDFGEVFKVEAGEQTTGKLLGRIRETKQTVIKNVGEVKGKDIQWVMTGGKQSSQEYLQSLYQNIKLPKKIARRTKKIPTTTKTSVIQKVRDNLPSMVGGTGLTTSKYSGTGQYEQVTFEGTRVSGIQSPALTIEPRTTQGFDFKTNVKTLLNTRPDETIRIKTLSNIRPSERTTTEFKPAQQERPKLMEFLKERIAQKQQFKFKQQPVTQTTQTTTPRPPRIPKVPKMRITIPKVQRKSRVIDIISKRFKPSYEVQVRRKGKFERVGRDLLPLGKALKLGTKETTSTLAQTFRLIQKGKTRERDIRFKVPEDIFTRPLKPTTKIEYVERRGKTLKKRTGEIPEILKAQPRYFSLVGKKSKGGNIFGI